MPDGLEVAEWVQGQSLCRLGNLADKGKKEMTEEQKKFTPEMLTESNLRWSNFLTDEMVRSIREEGQEPTDFFRHALGRVIALYTFNFRDNSRHEKIEVLRAFEQLLGQAFAAAAMQLLSDKGEKL